MAEAGVIPRLARKILNVELLSLVLVLASLQMLVYGISSSLRGTDTRYLLSICLLAALLGWSFSKTQWSGIACAVLISAIGLAGIWIVGARLTIPLLELIRSLGVLVPQIAPAIQDKVPIDTTSIREAWSVVAQASAALGLRWQTWLLGLDKSVTVNDALIRNMIWSFIMWCFAAWTGWHAARRNAVLALLPGILLLAFVLSYSEYRIYSLWVMVLVMLLLMGVWNYKNHTTQWARRRVDYSDSILYDNAQAVVILALLVGTMAYSIPSLSWQDLREALRHGNKNEAAEMLGIRQQSVPVKTINVQKPSLPREHMLTEGFAQSEELVMTIQTGELPPISNPSLTADAPRHYWRSTIYDDYVGTGWLTTSTNPQSIKAHTPLIAGLLENYRPLHVDVKLQHPEGKLFWSGVLYSASIPFRADWRVRPQSNLFADQTALLQADLFAAATGKASYEADSYIPEVTVEQLRAASTAYPEDIQKRYLKLPGELPDRVPALAQEITKGIRNPYDKAKSIESFLRTNYPYDLEIPAPPEGQDVSDYFLFDLKRGYCDYYATAMVVLARASGLPARFVSGYASGSYDAPNARYIVRELNAHSWPEIYFPDIGWIEFEPTASQPEIVRIEKEAEILPVDQPASASEKFLFRLRNTGILYWISPFAITFLLIVLYFAFIERIWILHFAPARAVALLYRRYYRMGRSLAGPRTRAETASEFTGKLIHSIEEIDQRSRLPRSRPVKEEAQQLTHVYLLSLFSNHAIGKGDSKKAFEMWKRLRRHLWIARLKDGITRRFRRSPRE